jgi:hypothetical protein
MPAGAEPSAPAAQPAAVEPTPAAAAAPAASAVLPGGTPLKVMLNSELNTKQNHTGDRFDVTVLEDVVQDSTIVIPKGAIGHGEIIFAADRGGFGKAGLLYIALRKLDVGDKSVLLDGRFREEGKDKNGATAATYFAVGVFAGFIKGKPGTIPKGRELQARTGEPIEFVPGAPPPPVPTPAAAPDQTAALPAPATDQATVPPAPEADQAAPSTPPKIQ